MVEVRAEAYVRRLTGVNRICLLSSSAGTWVHKRVVGSERRGSGWIVSNPETDPPPTRRIVSPPPIYATVSGTHGSNSGIPHQRLGAFAGTVLSQLRARGGRSPHLRRLLGRNLPGLRYAARNARGPRDRLIHGAAHHSAAGSRGPSGTLAGARPLAD